MINYAIYLFANPMISFGYVVLLRIQTLMFTPKGISQGICIVTAHLTGAKRFKTLSQTLKKLIIIVMLVTAIVGVIYLFSYKSIIVYFTDNTEAKKAIGSLIVFSILSLFSQPVVRITNYYFIGIGKSIYSLLSILLNVSMFVVFMLIGEVLFNSHEFGIFMAIVLLM